jgi:hypothetical protein
MLLLADLKAYDVVKSTDAISQASWQIERISGTHPLELLVLPDIAPPGIDTGAKFETLPAPFEVK